MIRVLFFLAIVFLIAAGFAWLADRPGEIALQWQGYLIETSLMAAVLMIALGIFALYLLWSVLRAVIGFPALLGGFFTRRRRERGWNAISDGMLAVHGGDATLAARKARESKKYLTEEPMTKLLIAQSAVLAGDSAAAKEAFADMLSSDETRLLGLHGLFSEARKGGDAVAARGFAEQALKAGTRAEWAGVALFEDQCANRDWQGALDTLALNISHKLVDRESGKRQRAVILTALAQETGLSDADLMRKYALEAQKLAPGLVPAALVAAQVTMRRNEVSRAAKLIETAWKLSPHPDLASAYAHLRPGDSTQDRIGRIKRLNRLKPGTEEGQIALARSAIDAQDWATARGTLTSLIADHPGQAACLMMAEIEHKETDNRGAVREWMSRALRAPRDKAWVGDGMVHAEWDAISPVSKLLDGIKWQVPELVEQTGAAGQLADRPHIAAQLSALSAETLLSFEEMADVVGAAEEPAEAIEDVTPDADPVAEDPRTPVIVEPAPVEAEQAAEAEPEAEAEAEAEAQPAEPPVDNPGDEPDSAPSRQDKLAHGEIPPPPDDPGTEKPEEDGRFKLF